METVEGPRLQGHSSPKITRFSSTLYIIITTADSPGLLVQPQGLRGRLTWHLQQQPPEEQTEERRSFRALFFDKQLQLSQTGGREGFTSTTAGVNVLCSGPPGSLSCWEVIFQVSGQAVVSLLGF